MKQQPHSPTHHQASSSLYSFKGTEQQAMAPNIESILVSACSPSLTSNECTPLKDCRRLTNQEDCTGTFIQKSIEVKMLNNLNLENMIDHSDQNSVLSFINLEERVNKENQQQEDYNKQNVKEFNVEEDYYHTTNDYQLHSQTSESENHDINQINDKLSQPFNQYNTTQQQYIIPSRTTLDSVKSLLYSPPSTAKSSHNLLFFGNTQQFSTQQQEALRTLSRDPSQGNNNTLGNALQKALSPLRVFNIESSNLNQNKLVQQPLRIDQGDQQTKIQIPFNKRNTDYSSQAYIFKHKTMDNNSSIDKSNNSNLKTTNTTQGSIKQKVKMNIRSKSKRMKSSQLIKEGKFQEALEEVNSMLRNDTQPNTYSSKYSQSQNKQTESVKNAQAYYLRGQIYEKQGQFLDAIQEYQKALECDKTLVNAAFAKAACENKIGNYEDAINSYNHAFAIDSDFNNGLYGTTSPKQQKDEPHQLLNDYTNTDINREKEKQSQESEVMKTEGNSEKYIVTSRLDAFSPQSRLSQSDKNSFQSATILSQPPQNDQLSSQADNFTQLAHHQQQTYTDEKIFLYRHQQQQFHQINEFTNNKTQQNNSSTYTSNTREASANNKETTPSVSKFGKIQINLNNIKRINTEKIQDRQRSCEGCSSNASRKEVTPLKSTTADNKHIQFFISPRGSTKSNNSNQNSVPNLNKRIENSLVKDTKSHSHLNNNATVRHGELVEISLNKTQSKQQVQQLINPYSILQQKRKNNKSRENAQKLIKSSTSIQNQGIKKLQSHIAFVKSKQFQKNMNLPNTSKPTNKSGLNSTLRGNVHQTSLMFNTLTKQLESNKSQRHSRKVSDADSSIISKLQFPNTTNQTSTEHSTIQYNCNSSLKPLDKKETIRNPVNVINISIKDNKATRNSQPLQTQKSTERYSSRLLPQQNYQFQCLSSRSNNSRFTINEGIQQKLKKNDNYNSSRSIGQNSNIIGFSSRRVVTHENDDKKSNRSNSRSISLSGRSKNSKIGNNTISIKAELSQLQKLLNEYLTTNKTLKSKVWDSISSFERKQLDKSKCEMNTQMMDQFYQIKYQYLYSQREYNGALNILEKHISQKIDTRLLKINCLRKLGQIDKSIEEVQKYLVQESQSEENSIQGYYIKGKLMMLKSDFKSAIINFNNVQLIREDDLRVFVRRTECYMKIGQERKAKEDIENILNAIDELKDKDLKYIQLTVSQLQSYPQLHELILQLIDKVMQNTDVNTNNKYYSKIIESKAKLILKQQKDYQQAINLLNSIPLKSDSTFLLLSKLYYKIKQYKNSMDSIQKTEKPNVKGSYLKAKLYLKESQGQQSLDELNFIIQSIQDYSKTQLNQHQIIKVLKMKGQSLYLIGKYDKAEAIFTEIIDKITQFGKNDESFKYSMLKDCYSIRAKCYQKLLKFEEAVQDFSQLIDNPKINSKRKSVAQILLMRAMSFEGMGNQDNCQKDLENAVQQSYYNSTSLLQDNTE